MSFIKKLGVFKSKIPVKGLKMAKPRTSPRSGPDGLEASVAGRLDHVPKPRTLQDLAAQELQPVLDWVNDAYLQGRGALSVQVREADSLQAEGCSPTGEFWPGPCAELRLSWDEWSGRTSHGDKRLWLVLFENQTVILGSGSETSSEFMLEEEGWREQLENDIRAIMSSPDRCSWSCYWSNG
jgi:hypothetical protein